MSEGEKVGEGHGHWTLRYLLSIKWAAGTLTVFEASPLRRLDAWGRLQSERVLVETDDEFRNTAIFSLEPVDDLKHVDYFSFPNKRHLVMANLRVNDGRKHIHPRVTPRRAQTRPRSPTHRGPNALLALLRRVAMRTSHALHAGFFRKLTVLQHQFAVVQRLSDGRDQYIVVPGLDRKR